MKKKNASFRTLLSSIASRRKLRNGTFSILLTLLVLSACILGSILGDTLENQYALQRDFSFNGATTQSRITTEQLQMLDEDVHIYVLSSLGNTNQSLLSLLTRYAAITDHLTFSQENISANPLLLTRFEDILGENEVSSDCIIVHCEKNDRARVLVEDDFAVAAYDADTGFFVNTGINYDKPLTEAIVYVAQDDPLTLQLLRGHGELSGENMALMQQMLTEANYQLQEVNLLSGGTLDVQSPLLILCPQLDMNEKELQLLMDFANAGGDFFIVSHYSDPLDLTHFNTLYRTFGISFFSGLTIAKAEDTQSYYNNTQAYLMPRMHDHELTRPLIESGHDVLLMPGSRAIFLPESTVGGLIVEPLIISGQSYIRDYVHAEPDMMAQQPDDAEGYFALAALCTRISDEGQVSKAHVIGNSIMFTHYDIENITYSRDYLLRAVQYLQGQAPINLDISAKQGIRQSLTLGSLAPAVIIIILLPLLVLLIALKILLPRRHL